MVRSRCNHISIILSGAFVSVDETKILNMELEIIFCVHIANIG